MLISVGQIISPQAMNLNFFKYRLHSLVPRLSLVSFLVPLGSQMSFKTEQDLAALRLATLEI